MTRDAYDRGRPRSGRRRAPRSPRKRSPREKKHREPEVIVGIDGEGVGRSPHLYTYLAAVDENGQLRGAIADDRNLRTERILSFLLSLGAKRVFGYSLGYDLTKWLYEMPSELVYVLLRPELRTGRYKGRRVLRPVDWRGFRLQFMRGKFEVSRTRWDDEKRRVVAGKSVVVWDVWRFYQGSFVKALRDWKTVPEDKIAQISAMKGQRSDFESVDELLVQRYCRDECHALARLVRQLIDAHERVGLELKGFYGAGSTGAALLTKMGVRDYIAEPPLAMRDAVARAFFGGRFENRVSGPVRQRVYGADISSAYPYVLTGLPCLVHGSWERFEGKGLDRRVEGASLACVRAEARERCPGGWGPLPWRAGQDLESPRMSKGSIVFPERCESWVWRDEYLAARDGWGVRAREAWVYRTECDCRPFAELAQIYVERVRIGKEGPGIVLKLGPNSCYGKLVQSVGEPKFRSFVWGGCVTSGCRAMLLRAIASNPESVLMAATDGIYSTAPLTFPEHRDTGTAETGKPLGGWEETVHDAGVFLARPGVYFPLDLRKEDTKVRARGMARSALFEHAERMVEHWERWSKLRARRDGAPAPYVVDGMQRFVGARTGIQVRGKKGVQRSLDYGEWIDWPVEVSFDPAPKRRTIKRDGTLSMWREAPGLSAPYDRAVISLEALLLREMQDIAEDQPDVEMSMRD